MVPNLSLDSVKAELSKSGISDWTEFRQTNKTKASLEKMPLNFLEAVAKRYTGRREDLGHWLSFASQIAGTPEHNPDSKFPSNGDEWWKTLRSSVIRGGAKNNLRDLYANKKINRQALAEFISDITGEPYSPSKDEEQIDKELSLDPKHVQMMLDRYSDTIKTVVAYESSEDFRVATDKPNATGELSMKSGGENLKFKMRTPIYGHKTFLNEKYKDLSEMWQVLTGSDTPHSPSELGSVMGKLFDQSMGVVAKKEGIVKSSERAALDIPGFVKGIVSNTNISGPVSAIEIKSSAEEAMSRSGGLPEKIFRTLAGEPVGRMTKSGVASSHLKGPVEDVPKIANVPQFKATLGKIGVLDYSHFGDKSTSKFQAAIYAAIAQGKSLKINYGSRLGMGGLGLTSSAVDTASKYNKGIDDPYVKTIEDLDKFEQIILTSTARANISKKVTGLAFSTASNVEAFKPSPELLAQMDPDDVEDYANNMDILQKKLGDRFSYKKAAKGSIPSILEALSAENSATNGNAILSFSNKLISSMNPNGLAAIDRRSQSNADDAINQHQFLGQSLSQIKSMRSAGGRIPNLSTAGMESNSIGYSTFMALTQYGTGLLTSTKYLDSFKLSLGRLISSEERAVIKVNQLSRAYDKALDEVAKTGKTTWTDESGKSQEFSSAEQLDKLIHPSIAAAKESVRPYQESEASRIEKLKSRGLGVSIKAGFFGGVVSNAASGILNSPTAGVAVDELTKSAQEAGQALWAFPNLGGKALAVGVAFAGAANTVDILSKGLATYRRDYDISQAKFQKLAAQIDGVTTSMNSFDNLITDSAVSMSAIIREQRKYNELMGQMGQSEEGQTALSKMAGAPDNRTKTAALQEYRESQSRGLNRQASLLNLREYASERTFKVAGYTFGKSALGYSNDIQKNEVNQLVSNASTDAVGSMDDKTKQRLMDASYNPKAFNDLVNNSKDFNGEFSEFLRNLETVLGKQNMPIMIASIRQNLATERSYNSPKGQASLDAYKARVADRQLSTNAAVRAEATARRQFVNQGALSAGNVLDIRAMNQQTSYNKNLIGLSQMQASGGVLALGTGERTMRQYQANVDIKRIDNEHQNAVADVQNQSTRSITDLVTQNFDQYITHTDLSNKMAYAGQAAVANVPIPKSKLIESLNTGILGTVKAGNFDRFKENGVLNNSKLIEEIVGRSGGDSHQQAGVKAFLQSNASVEILKSIENTNNQLVGIDQKSLTEAQQTVIAFKGFQKEMSFKEMASYMGGIKTLLDRGSRRGMERDAVKNSFLMQRGSTAEIRGIGGAGVLDWFKKMNIPIELNGKSPQSKLMTQAWGAAKEGLKSVYGKSMGRILSSQNRIVGGNASSGFGAYAVSFNPNSAAESTLRSEFKPENASLTKESVSSMDSITVGLSGALTKSTSDVLSFGSAFKMSAEELMKIISQSTKTREANDKANKADAQEQQTSSRKEAGTEGKNPVEDQKKNWLHAGMITKGIGGLATVATIGYAVSKYFNKGKIDTPKKMGTNFPRSIGENNSWENITNASRLDAPALFSTNTQIGKNKLPPIYIPPQKPVVVTPKGLTMATGYIEKKTATGQPIIPNAAKLTMAIEKLTMLNPSSPVNQTEVATNALNVPITSRSKRKTLSGREMMKRLEETSQHPVVTYDAPPKQLGLPDIESPTGIYRDTKGRMRSYKKPPGASGFAHTFGGGMMKLSGGMAGQMMAMHGIDQINQGNNLTGAGMLAAGYLPEIAQAGKSALANPGMLGMGARAAMRFAGPVGIAYGAAQGIKYGGRKLMGIDKLDNDLSQGENSYITGTTNYVNHALSKGKSVKEVEDYLRVQIRSTEGQLKQSKVKNTSERVLGAIGLGADGKSSDVLQGSLDQLHEMLQSVENRKDSLEAGKKEDEYNSKVLAALEKIANINGNGGGSAEVKSSINVEISLKDSNIPESITSKFITPLIKQLGELETRVNILSNRVAPQPAQV
jgi:hypothetical protein